MPYDQEKAAEAQISREVRDETLILTKEARLLLEKIEEFRREQNAAATIIKETQKANREMQNYFKLITYFIFTDDKALDFIQQLADKSNDSAFSKWLKNMRTLRGED